MPPRKRTLGYNTTASASPSKRRKPSSDDDIVYNAAAGTPADWAALVSASSLSTESTSTRPARFKAFPTLVSCCIRRFATTFRSEYGGQLSEEAKAKARELSQRERQVEALRLQDVRGHIRREIKILPDYLREKVWERLVLECPGILNISVINKARLMS
jgi:hypothetical protein